MKDKADSVHFVLNASFLLTAGDSVCMRMIFNLHARTECFFHFLFLI